MINRAMPENRRRKKKEENKRQQLNIIASRRAFICLNSFDDHDGNKIDQRSS